MELEKNAHPFIFEEDMRSLCQNLFDKTDIKFFNYARIYANDCVALSTNAAPLAEAFRVNAVMNKESLDKMLAEERVHQIHNTYYYFLNDGNKKASQLANELGIKDTFVTIYPRGDYYECFCFASDRIILPYYFENFGLLVRFKSFFTDKSHKIIESTVKNKIRLSNSILPYSHDSDLEKKTPIIDDLDIGGFYLDLGGKSIKISNNELCCLRLWARGKTRSQISEAIGIAEKTVDFYREKLQNRLSVSSRHQLVDIFLKSDLVAC